jgi:hypothetical protein
MRKLGALAWALVLIPAVAFATTPILKTIDQISARGGTTLTVPSSGANLISDSATQTLTNKTFSAASNTFTPNVNQDLFLCAGNTSFTLTATPAAVTDVMAEQNGLLLTQGASYDYTISGTTLTTSAACPTGAQLLVVYAH